jgi:hypothetical protein
MQFAVIAVRAAESGDAEEWYDLGCGAVGVGSDCRIVTRSPRTAVTSPASRRPSAVCASTFNSKWLLLFTLPSYLLDSF